MQSSAPVAGSPRLVQAIRRNDLLLVTVVMVPLLLFFLGPALAGQGAFLPADLAFGDSLWSASAPAEYQMPANGLTSDLYYLFYPMRYFAAETLHRTGHLPLWNPFIFGGQPYLADGQSSMFYPLNWLSYWLPASTFFAWAAAIRLYLAALFTTLLLRSLGCSRGASLLAGLAYAFCGPMVVWQGYPIPDVFLWLPAALWALQRVFASRRVQLWLVLLAIFIALAGLPGHYESYFHVLVVIAAYAAYKLVSTHLDNCRYLALGIVLALSIGIGVTAVQTLPFGLYLEKSATMLAGGRSSIGPQDSWWYSPKVGPSLASAVALIFPDAFGNPATHDYYWPFAAYQNYSEQSVYVGTLPLLLALIALMRPRRKGRLFFIALAVTAFGVAYRVPLFEAVNHLPVFSAILNKRLRVVVAFSLAVLAGYGADDLLLARFDQTQLRRMVRVVGGAALGLTAVAAGWYLIVLLLRQGRLQVSWLQPLLPSLTSVFRLSRVRTWLPVPVALLSAACMYLYARRRLARMALLAALLALTAGELIALGRGYCPTLPAQWLYPNTPALTFLRSQTQPVRVLGADQAFQYNAGMVTGIPEIGGYDLPAPRRLSALYKQMGGQDIHRQRWQPEWPVTELLGVQYVVCRRDLPADRFDLVYDGDVRIYRVRNALPRLFAVTQLSAAQDEAQALAGVLSTMFDPRQEALVEVGNGALPGPLTVPAELAITEYGTDSVTVRSRSTGPSFLVLTEAYEDGWSVTIDGRPGHVYPTDYLWRGVSVPAGEHVIQFHYDPPGYRIGLVLSLFSLAVLGLGAAYAALGRRRAGALAGSKRI